MSRSGSFRRSVEDGKWHDGFDRSERLSRSALARFEALIKSEKSRAAKKACKVPKKKRR